MTGEAAGKWSNNGLEGQVILMRQIRKWGRNQPDRYSTSMPEVRRSRRDNSLARLNMNR